MRINRVICNLYKYAFALMSIMIMGGCAKQNNDKADQNQAYSQVSGIFPHLAMYNEEGECGTGAVVPWADKLWVITYGPHLWKGSSDKLYEIDSNLNQTIRPESIGGTPANRLIHKESKQLFIGPYVISNQGNVRVIPVENMMGRLTGSARHLTDSENKIYTATMEEGFYEVDVNTLKVNTIFADLNVKHKGNKIPHNIERHSHGSMLPGAHGKGLYSGQGVLVYSNNGEPSKLALKQFDIEAGVLAEWDGQGDWKVVRRNQFVEVTGPGGIYGNENPDTDPLWATGWDHKSVLLGVRDAATGWSFYRLPKASHSYDGAHGWNTEWPRIRNVGTEAVPDYLMTMHGMFWKFPGEFTAKSSAGIRARSAYLKVIGDYTRWKDQLVFGCDDSAEKEFLNVRSIKGNIEGVGQSNSNLWFTSLSQPDELGSTTSNGALWINEQIEKGAVSDPFLFAGWQHRVAWVHNHGAIPAKLKLELSSGNDVWSEFKEINVAPKETQQLIFTEKGEWIRVQSIDKAQLTFTFNYTDPDNRSTDPDPSFDGMAAVEDKEYVGGLLYSLGADSGKMGLLAMDKASSESGYYELDEKLNLLKTENDSIAKHIRNRVKIPKDVITIEKSSILIVDDENRRWRLPLGAKAFTVLHQNAKMRIAREVVTERDLLHVHGTFYELPAENADGFAKIRPISSHNYNIHDFTSFRGMMVLTGIDLTRNANVDHVVTSKDKKAAVWLGVIDDLWKLGKPVGYGGPWKDTKVNENTPSDPYLISHYDKKTLKISHDHTEEVVFTVEIEPIGHGSYMKYKELSVKPEETLTYEFPESFSARWVRFKTNQSCNATTLLIYE